LNATEIVSLRVGNSEVGRIDTPKDQRQARLAAQINGSAHALSVR